MNTKDFLNKLFFFLLAGGWDNEKQLVPKSDRTPDLRILRSNTLTLRHSDLTDN